MFWNEEQEAFGDIEMSIVINCANCSQKLRIREDLIGRVGCCPSCKKQFQVARATDGTLAVMAILDSQNVQSSEKIARPPNNGPTSQSASEPTASGKLKKAPFFVENAAVIECPWCNKRMKVDDDSFNDELICPSCDKVFEVEVYSRNWISFKCPSCLLKMKIAAAMASSQTYCDRDNCRYGPIKVPDSPIKIVRILIEPARSSSGDSDKKTTTNQPSMIERILTHPPAIQAPRTFWRPPDPRRCQRCFQRFVRNPTGICHKCQ